MKKWTIIAISFMGGIAGAFVFSKLKPNTVLYQVSTEGQNSVSSANYKSTMLESSSFIKASKDATPAVVFIKTLSNQRNYVDPFFDFWNNMDFFGRRGPVASSGSGVILTDDGYIVTNNHVVKDADVIEVITNNQKQSYKAKIIGTDPSTDLALLKIEGSNLPHLTLGNSDNVEIGEWVIAVGNPFNLTSTVTAGIVSAKGRNINIVNNQFPIESFIQTDAAINPGNSGGALVDLNGKLIGINTAIASNTGSYNGYGFAIPVNIVAKIVKDLVEFKEVQRGFTGMDVKDIDAELAKKLNINNNLGVYVSSVLAEGPADNAGVRAGDIIVKVNGRDIDSKSIFDEHIEYLRPGEKAKMSIIRNGKEMEFAVNLLNREGTTAIMRKGTVSSDILGADFQSVPKIEKDKLGIKNGIRISNLRQGRMAGMGLSDGFIIISLNKKEYEKPDELIKDLEKVRGQIVIDGIFPNGGRGVFSFYSN
ncbi:MAG: trypsin-like peptidase domain-containing protein [Bacteroidetes bacterium]|nr:trypsin-like peptidase domain-containing protein [Bacteroidota bacterium]